MTKEKRENHMIHIIMTEYALKKVLGKVKERGKAEVTKELIELHVLETFAPVDGYKLIKKHIVDAAS